MSDRHAFRVHLCNWATDAPALRQIRHDVFVVEQHVPEALEWDDADAQCVHALAVDGRGAPVGCARLLPDGHIGRVAVVREWRGHGVGSAMLQWMVDEARSRGFARVVLNSQVAAIPFYARHGFVASGDVFDEAGIPHREMERSLR